MPTLQMRLVVFAWSVVMPAKCTSIAQNMFPTSRAGDLHQPLCEDTNAVGEHDKGSEPADTSRDQIEVPLTHTSSSLISGLWKNKVTCPQESVQQRSQQSNPTQFAC